MSTIHANNGRMKKPLAFAALATLPSVALADPPDFDRPGAGFATSVLPVGTLAIEQGLPTYERQRDDGLLDRTYAADSVVRLGLGNTWEAQFGASAWNRLEERGGGSRRHVVGHGDSSLGLKYAPSGTDGDGPFTWAALGQVTFADGNQAFSNGARQYTLGATLQWMPDKDHQNTLYANVDRLKGRNTWTLAPTFGRSFGEHWMAYAEVDAIHDAQDGNEVQAGGGVAYTIGDHVQLDAYALHRIGSHGPSVRAGLGVAVFFGRKS